MRSTGKPATSTAASVAILVALLLTTLLAGCSDAPRRPVEAPSIRGTVFSLDRLESGEASLLVVADDDVVATAYDRAVVRVTQATEILDAGGNKRTTEYIRNGLRVEVWFVGGVAESYPVQATAGTIAVIGEKAPRP
ncbi:MAG: DUF3221 domain-containing protein [Coriobacteriia bacterium]|jgi:hypothetical protein|nr:DUF3221 domain-containing protein [Coriobacteriia bacterium]